MSDRTKADFRALRELVGMSQGDVADALDVQVLSVKRWERPDIDGCEPPDDAWDVLDDARAMQTQVVDYAVGKAGSISTDMGGEPQAVQLPYWRTQDAYDAAHPDDAGPVGCANANVRLVADRLESFGFEVRFEYPPDE